MTNREFAIHKEFDNMLRYIITCGTAASLTTGDYFFYNNGSVDYYIWFDKNGDGTTDDPSADPNLTGKTGVAVDISSATTAKEVATALVTAIDALSNSEASQLDEVVYIIQTSEELDPSMSDYNTDFTFSSDGYLAKNGSPSCKTLTQYREEIYGNMIKYIPGTPNTGTYANTFRDIEYRGVELKIDKEQGRAEETGRPMYVPSDYIYSNDRIALAGMGGSSSFTRGTGT